MLAEGGLEVCELDRAGIRHNNVLDAPYALDLAATLDGVIEEVLDAREQDGLDTVLQEVV